jgi:Mg-chelatase subunit ChlD
MAKKEKNNVFKNIDLDDEDIVVKKPKKSKKQTIYNLIILDKSGSMGTVRDVTVSGINEQLQSIKKASVDFKNQVQKVCLVTFNDTVDNTQIWDKNIKDVEEFTTKSYDPNGTTALLDAVGIGVTKLKSELEKKSSQNNIVIVTILTDGEENCSKEYNQKQIKDLLKNVQDVEKWTVAFVGCGDNVFEVAASMNISGLNTLNFTPGVAGTTQAFDTMASSRYYRSLAYSNCSDNQDLGNISANIGFFEDANTAIDPNINNITPPKVQ